MLCEEFRKIGEYGAMGAYENEDRGLFYRKALGLRRYYENCKLFEYKGKPLYPSGTKAYDTVITYNYLNGMDILWGNVTDENRQLIQRYADDFLKFRSKLPEEHAVVGNMWCHAFPNYGRIIREGFNSYVPRIKKIEDEDLRDGLLHIYEGIKFYIGRCVEYLESVGADEKLINALKKVPLEKADNIYEALVSWNFVLYLDNCDNLGCPAEELYEFYKGEDIVYLLENLFENIDESGGYSMALHTNYNELTIQCLKAARGKRRPMIELFVDENTPDEVWKEAFSLMRTHGGQPAFYNPKVLLEGFKNKLDVSDEDIKLFCGGGCTESMIAGKSNIGSCDASINLLLIFEQVMYDYLPKAENFDDFYNEYVKNVLCVVNDIMDKISLSQKERAIYNPLPMRTFLIDDCIDEGKEFNNGGARYTSSNVSLSGTINVIDSLMTVKEMIFEEKSINVQEFLHKLKDNDEEFLKKCRGMKKCFGKDDKETDALAHEFTKTVCEEFDKKDPYLGGKFLPSSIQFMGQAAMGRIVGATPDGRSAGSPLCDSLGAIFGKDVKGPTALLKSVTSLDLKDALGVPVLNFNIDEKWDDNILKALILSYMEMGGIQMQITCISEEMLMEAYENPDMHKNLVVRVGGYSEYFYRLPDDLKKMVINRTIQKM